MEPFDTGVPGVLGVRAFDDLTADDYHVVVQPLLQSALEAGEVRLVLVLPRWGGGRDFGGLAQNARVGVQALGPTSAWRRSALVTDDRGLARAARLFGWMAPGEVATFASADLGDAIAWAAG